MRCAEESVHWDRKTVQRALLEMAEPDYQTFASGLIPGGKPMLGVRLPALRSLAKRIARSDWRAFLSLQMDESFEETLLRGMVIGYAKADAGELFVHVAHFVPEINDWSTCDSFAIR